MFIIWTIPSALANNIETLLVCRYFAGFAGGTFLSTSGGTIADLYEAAHIQVPMAFFTLSTSFGATLGPFFGGFINYNTDYKWTTYFTLIWAAMVLLALLFFCPETHRREIVGAEHNMSISSVILVSVKRPFQLLLLEPMCLCLAVYAGILLGTLYLFFGAFPLVFHEAYGMNAWQIGLTFTGMAAGMCIATLCSPLLDSWRLLLIQSSHPVSGTGEPEYRLLPGIVGSLMVPIGLFLFSWTSITRIHWIVPIIGSSLFGCGYVLPINHFY